MFKVGDTVYFGADEYGYPLWDMNWRRDAEFAAVASGEVVEADDRTFLLRFDSDDEAREWTCLQSRPADADEHWFRSGRAALVSRGEPAWMEVVSVRRGSDLPDPVRARAIDSGERGVRRNLRFWPYEKRLVWEEARIPGALEDRVEFRWFWESEA